MSANFLQSQSSFEDMHAKKGRFKITMFIYLYKSNEDPPINKITKKSPHK